MNFDRTIYRSCHKPTSTKGLVYTSVGSLCTQKEIIQLMEGEIDKYFETGNAYAEDVLGLSRSENATKVNPTLYECLDGRYTLHYDLVPFRCFYHAFQFSRKKMAEGGMSKTAIDKVFVNDSYFELQPLLSNSVQQFVFWLQTCSSALQQSSLSSNNGPCITFTFNCSDANMFCLDLQCPANDKGCSISQPLFDLVYSSNLADHIALPNLVLTVLPLVKQGGLIFTSTFLYRCFASTAEEYIKCLFGMDSTILPILT